MKTTVRSLAHLDLSEAKERTTIATICEWERLAYGEGKHRTTDAFHDCVKKNRTGFFVINGETGLVGYADIWQLPSDFYSKLKIGTIDEESIAAKYILSGLDQRSSLWYIGSIITDPSLRASRPMAAALAFTSICNVLPSFFRSNSQFPAKVLGVGSSQFGKKLLTRWGFAPVSSAPNAIDLRPRFEITLNVPKNADAFHLGRKLV